jgi:hypothetical protein
VWTTPVAARDSEILDWPSLLNLHDGVYNSSGFVVTEDATTQLTHAAYWRFIRLASGARLVCFADARQFCAQVRRFVLGMIPGSISYPKFPRRSLHVFASKSAARRFCAQSRL